MLCVTHSNKYVHNDVTGLLGMGDSSRIKCTSKLGNVTIIQSFGDHYEIYNA